jgi:hypothetical protein
MQKRKNDDLRAEIVDMSTPYTDTVPEPVRAARPGIFSRIFHKTSADAENAQLKEQIKIARGLLVAERKAQEDIVASHKRVVSRLEEDIRKGRTFDPLRSTDLPMVTQMKNFFGRITTPKKNMMINMELANGDHDIFIAAVDQERFNYKNKTYIYDESLKYYVRSCQMWALDFHENFALAVQRKIPLNKLNQTLRDSGITDVDMATNPSLLGRFQECKMIEGVLKSQEFMEQIKRLMVMIAIGAFASLLHLILFVWKSGMLDKVKIPGMG